MNKKSLIRIGVCDILGKMSKKGTPTIEGSTRPRGDLGLDSIDGLNFACAIDVTLGVHLPDDADPFTDGDSRLPRSVDEIVDYIHEIAQLEGEPANG